MPPTPRPRARRPRRPSPVPRRKVALVTGGGTGIGLAIARWLARHDFDLVLASRSVEHLADGARALRSTGARVLTVPTDVREPAQVERLMAAIRSRFGRLDLLVNNAAGNFLSRAEEITPNGWRAVVGIVLDGTFYCSRAALPMLRTSPGGAVVNVVAAYAWTAGPGTAHSAAAKAGVVSLTRTLAVEWARYGVRVNAVAPGPVRTEGTDRQLWSAAEQVEAVRRTVPMGRFGTPEEIAEAVGFLASDRAGYITGEVLTVDGGQWLGAGLGAALRPSAGQPRRPTHRASRGGIRRTPRRGPTP